MCQYISMIVDATCCPPLHGAALDRRGAEDLATLLRALADPARLRLVSLIAAGGELCACDLTAPLGLSQPTVSHHLKVLVDAGFLRREQRGRWADFSVVPERLREVAAALQPR
jgi:ArsR family transcriptional regulator